jgi:nucleotide-binding universal stress UspA family protein
MAKGPDLGLAGVHPRGDREDTVHEGHTIVVGMDSTPGSAEALRWALHEAVARHWALHLVHGLPDAGPEGNSDFDNRLAAEVMLAAAALRAADVGIGEVRQTVAARPAGPLLIELSEDAALLVVGARRHDGTPPGPRGNSVGDHVSRFARCPVVVVASSPNAPTGLIAVNVRGDAADRRALEFAFDHAAAAHAEVEVVHAWREPEPGPLDFSALVDDRIELHRRASEVMVGEQLAGFATTHPDVPVRRVSLPADPRDALLWSSAQADLLVLAAPDPAAERCGPDLVELTALRHSHCPVVFAR